MVMKRKCSEFQHAGSQLADLGSHQHLFSKKTMGKAFEKPWENGSMASESHGILWNPTDLGWPSDLVTWLLRRRPPQMCSCWSRKWPKGWRSWKTNCLRRQNSSIFRGYLWWAKWLDLGRWIFIHPKMVWAWPLMYFHVLHSFVRWGMQRSSSFTASFGRWDQASWPGPSCGDWLK